MLSPAKLLALSNRVYCLLLYLYPVSFRREYGTHMAQLFRDDMRGTLRDDGRLAVVGLWLLAFFDLLKTAVAEHIWEIFNMPIEKLTRWSGPAGAMGGLLYALGIIGIAATNADAAVVGSVIAVVTVLLMVFGLFGLYKCLPTTIGRLNTLTFSVAAAGLLTLHIGWVISVWTHNFGNRVDVIAVGAIFLGLTIMGLAGMGIIALATQALGRWSFTPLLVSAAYIFMFSSGYLGPGSTAGTVLLLTVFVMSWLLLGVALWQTHEEPLEPGLFA